MHGLGIAERFLSNCPICSKDELKDVHFDTRQYRFTVWEEAKLDECKKELQVRIEAAIGRGKYKPPSA